VAQSAVVVRAGGNLPAEVTSFVGRRRELADAKRALSKSRLVTLTGVGGVGKTRVAERLARDRRRAYPHGVWLVELGQLANPALLSETVLTGLCLRVPPSGDDALGLLTHSLSSRQLLLVLDNCEHLLDEVAALSTALLRSCPGVQVLATSREPLHVVGEAVVAVAPMATPRPDRSGVLAGLSRYDAVALFAERAAAALPNFALTEENSRAVAALCYRLDGLPLAIELAAGRLRSMPPAQILSKLDDRYALLTGGERGRPDRQQTLRASIEWSYQLCTLQEQRLWARLCVFAGSFELDAVEAVCTGDIAGDEIVDLVSGLVDKSIVVRHEGGTVARYRLLDTIREFGLERLTEAGDGPALRMRHSQWYAALIHTAKAEWISERQVYWLARLAAEGANIRSALDFCLNELGDADAVMEVVAGVPLGLLWARGGLSGRRWLDAALARSSGVTVLRVRAILRNSILAMVGGDVATGNQLLDEARVLIRQVSDPMVLAQLHHVAARSARFAGDLPLAVSELEQALAMTASTTDLDSYLDILILLAYFAAMAGQHERSKACYEETIQLTEPRGESLHRAYALMALGLDAWRRGDIVHAVQLQRSSLEIKVGFDDRLGTAVGLEALAWGVGALGQHKRAAHLLGAAEVVWDSTAASLATVMPELVGEHDKSVAAARAALGDQGYAAAFRRGRQLPLAQALNDAELTRRSTKSGQMNAGGAGSLTSREEEVAGLLTQGLSNKAIAKSLVIAQRTAETHVANVLVKLGLTSRSQVAAWVAEQRGIDSSA
jgi:predicted ATPase/DNA-binding CsgD family transcriptional regulator